ncbi:Protein slowmo-like protein 2-like [Oopsacas minuta]|uniref:Protein slowmo-like protein 2-like n=1 Tax=Oopsacas minuta TaxID=111878 RepID=A0AAV7KKS3_9METZ|nr:Protein slowmo-like protein 2-like [Oopsacas minuta]
MRIWGTEYSFNDRWECIILAAFRKYPNLFNPAVRALDVLDRRVDERGRLISRRIIGTSWSPPSWAIKLLGLSRMPMTYVSECSVLDLNNRTLTLKSTNFTLASIIRIDETLTYSVVPGDDNRTLLEQEARISVFKLPFSGSLENLMADRISSMAGKGREAIEEKSELIKRELESIGNHTDSS